MKKLAWLSGIFLLGLAGFAYSQLSTEPQKPCGKTADMAKVLTEEFDESLVAHGLTEGKILSIWSSKDNKTWTIMITSGSISCYVTSGVNLKLVGNPI